MPVTKQLFRLSPLLRIIGQESKKAEKSALRSKCENAISGKANGQCARGDSCSFSHGPNRGSKAQSSSPAPQAWTQLRKRTLDNFSSQQRESFGKERSEIVTKINSKDLVRIRRVIIGILPRVKITTLNRNANSATVLFRHTEAAGQPSKKSEKSGGK